MGKAGIITRLQRVNPETDSDFHGYRLDVVAGRNAALDP
jgi:hypothetical protein